MNDPDNWDQHWNDFSSVSRLNPANAYRNTLIFNRLARMKTRPICILDIGCGQGNLIEKLSQHFPEAMLFGIESSAKGILLAKKRNLKATFFQTDIMLLDTDVSAINQKMDVAICMEVLEHLDDPLTFLIHSKKFLKKDAIFIITVPSGPRTMYDKYVGHRQHFSEKSIKSLLETAGFEINHIFKAGFPFFNVYKILVLLGGKRLIRDSKNNSHRILHSITMTVFAYLFKLNLSHSKWGWQLIVEAKFKKSME